MQRHRSILSLPAILMATVIPITIVTSVMATRLPAQADGNHAVSRISSEPVGSNTESATVPDGWHGPINIPTFAKAGGPSLAAFGDYVFVLDGHTLYQFAVSGLKLVGKTTLEQESLRSLKKK